MNPRREAGYLSVIVIVAKPLKMLQEGKLRPEYSAMQSSLKNWGLGSELKIHRELNFVSLAAGRCEIGAMFVLLR